MIYLIDSSDVASAMRRWLLRHRTNLGNPLWRREITNGWSRRLAL